MRATGRKHLEGILFLIICSAGNRGSLPGKHSIGPSHISCEVGRDSNARNYSMAPLMPNESTPTMRNAVISLRRAEWPGLPGVKVVEMLSHVLCAQWSVHNVHCMTMNVIYTTALQ